MCSASLLLSYIIADVKELHYWDFLIQVFVAVDTLKFQD